ncbi:MAG: flavodoxin family protein [Clostridia bacterium]|nr:flavodoxin family protein [Clostridia bacterium]
MKVLMINGSPNEKGCTFTALSEIAEVLRENGVDSEIIHIGREPVRGCTACGGCAGKGRCVFDDGVNKALDKLTDCDGLIIGSPVHYASPAGSLIAFLDRMFYSGRGFAHKPAAAVVSARRGGTTAALDVLNKYFTISQMPIVSSTYWNMVHGSRPEEVSQDAEGMQTMRNLGRNMAWLLRCIEAGRENGTLPPKAERGNRTNFVR